MSQKNLNTPMLFACADKVFIPHIGADETGLDKKVKLPDVSLLSKMGRSGTTVNNAYLKKISADLAFSEDVVREKAFHALPYEKKYFDELLDFTDVISELPKRFRKVKGIVGRHNNRVGDRKHLPCHIKKRSKHFLKPLKRNITDRGMEMEQQSLKKKEIEDVKAQEKLSGRTQSPRQMRFQGSRSATPDHVFLTQMKDQKSPVPPDTVRSDPGNTLGWDAYLLNIVSEDTAQWMVHQRTSPGEHREQLAGMLDYKYGPPTTNELVRDNSSDFDLLDKKEKPKKKWKKRESILLQATESVKDLPTDPYGDDNAATFYRLPAGARKQRKVQQKEDEGNNLTAKMVSVTRQMTPPPPTMKDFLNPNVGSKIFDTENEFEREWLTGGQVVHQIHGDQTKIVMVNNNKYKKSLRKVTPREPELWFAETKDERKEKLEQTTVVNKLEKGPHRWTGLPESVDDTAEILNLQQPGTVMDELTPVTPGNKLKKLKNNSSLLQIVDDWRAKWHLNARFSDATPEDLLRDMADIHPHIRCKAITTCARAAEYKPPPQQGIVISTEYKVDFISQLPEKVFVALKCLCDDPEDQVQRAAAITLYVLNKPNERAEAILRSTLHLGNTIDRWAAVQCLAHFGATDSEVVGELVAQLLNTEDGLKHSRCAELLSRLSQNTTLVHSMIAEQLNSSSWRHRVMACKVIPRLYGPISRDLSSKLTNLMWSDWHGEVRKAAAQTLGKTGHGAKVHDRLRKQLATSDERQKVDALNKIGKLGIMTAKLLPPFLACFDDEYLSVRMETCVACSNLRVEDPLVGEKLIFLASYDPIWKIKALAIQALGQIGRVTLEVRRTLLWALRYEENPGVRAEACHSLILLGLEDDEVKHILQDRFLVESSDVVKAEIAEALDKYGISDIEDIEMVAKIKDEVRKLCTRNNICAQIASNEAEEDLEMNRERLIYRSKSEKKKDASNMYRTVSNMSRSGSPQRAVFTPTAEQELNAVLEKDDDEYDGDDGASDDSSSDEMSEAAKSRAESRVRMKSTSRQSSFFYGGSRFSENDSSDEDITNFSMSPSHGRFESSAYSFRSTPRLQDGKQGRGHSRSATPTADRVQLAMKSETVSQLIRKHGAEDYQLCEGIHLGAGEKEATFVQGKTETERASGVDDGDQNGGVTLTNLPSFIIADDDGGDLPSSEDEGVGNALPEGCTDAAFEESTSIQVKDETCDKNVEGDLVSDANNNNNNVKFTADEQSSNAPSANGDVETHSGDGGENVTNEISVKTAELTLDGGRSSSRSCQDETENPPDS